MSVNPFPFRGLNTDEVNISKTRFGLNVMGTQDNSLWLSLKNSFIDPVFLLLVLSSLMYFLLNETSQAIFLLIAVLVISSISIYQETRSRRALLNLKTLTAQKAKVIRNNELVEISTEAIVAGDYIVIEEGTPVATDGKLVYAHDFSVNESILTGEAASVYKSLDEGNNLIYQGTLAVSGTAVYIATEIGRATRLGTIADSLKSIKSERSPLEMQIHHFVARMSVAGGIAFLLVWVINYHQSGNVITSLLKALTLAMSILPEEIPVAFTTFMALGAWRLMQKRILAKDVKTVEALGAATMICLDKTGTVTKNAMELAEIYVFADRHTYTKQNWTSTDAKNLITYAMWASESVPFDNMEKTLHSIYGHLAEADERPNYKMVYEYPLEGRPPMMTHVFADSLGHRIISAKGAPENLLYKCNLTEEQLHETMQITAQMGNKGYRVLAVAEGLYNEATLPQKQQDIPFNFLGLIAFNDPIKEEITTVFNQFYEAGLSIKIITGDNATTTKAIALQAGLKNAEQTLDGEALLSLDEKALKEAASAVNIFTRMFPEAKLKVIDNFKSAGHIVAMTGDGVNDALALKAAHIGIAMGKRGVETARNAASLILLDDDLNKIIDAIAMGRQIYNNLKKAIRYIISIHIPIILVVTIPLLLGWTYPNIFTPVHVVILELIMGPTCSIVFENEPMEDGLMRLSPRAITSNLLTLKELSTSILQGLAITAGALFMYQLGVFRNIGEDAIRTIVFITLISANIFLTLVNRSLYHSAFKTLHFKNNLLTSVLSATVLLMILILATPFFRRLFQFQIISAAYILLSVAAGFLSVVWFEVMKLYTKGKEKK